MATVLKPRYERLEYLLENIKDATLEFPKEELDMIRLDVEALGYNVVGAFEDQSTKIYHLHIRRI